MNDPSLAEVVARLRSVVGDFDEPQKPHSWSRISRRTVSQITDWFHWRFSGGLYFSSREIQSIRDILQRFSVAIRHNDVVDPDIFGPIRWEVTKASDFFISRIPSWAIRRRIFRVAHHNQNPRLERINIEQIVGQRNWLSEEISSR